MEAPFTDVPGALAEIRAGRMVVVVDDEDRENEGDLTLAAEYVTPEAINFMARYGRGLICLTLTEERADYLRLFPDDAAEFVAVRDGIHGDDRGARGSDDRHLGGRPGAHHSYGDRSQIDGCRPGPSRAHLSAAGAQGRRAGAGRADRGVGRPGADGGAQSLRA